MALLETQPLRTNVSATGVTQGPAAPATRSSVSLALSTGITPYESAGATTLLFEYRGDRHGPHRPGPYRPGPYYPGPYYPRPIPMPYPIPGYPTQQPGPLPGERACSFFEEGRWGSRQDIFGRWWCRW